MEAFLSLERGFQRKVLHTGKRICIVVMKMRWNKTFNLKTMQAIIVLKFQICEIFIKRCS